MAYIEVLSDEKAFTAIAFLHRAVKHYTAHGITIERLIEARSFTGEIDTVVSVSKTESPDVGTMRREESVVAVERRQGSVDGRRGDILVRTDQTLGTLAVYLLEPESDDGLVRWGYLDAILRPGALLPVTRVMEV